MKKFNRIWSYNKKYAKELDNSLQEVLPLVIKAFTNIYGKDYASYISNRIMAIDFIYYLPRMYFADILYSPQNVSKKDRYIADYYLSFLTDLEYKARSYKDPYIFIVENCFIESFKKVTDLNGYAVEKIIEDSNPSFITEIRDGLCTQTIYLPIFCLNLPLIMHEVNHALSVDGLVFTDKNFIEFDLFSNNLLNELINDYISLEAYHEYLRIGGKVPKSLRKLKAESEYAEYFYLIEYFYQSLKPLILQALITKNERIFTILVGEDNLKLFYDITHELENLYDEQKYQELTSVVDKMRDSVLAHEEFYDEKFYQDIKNQKPFTRKLIK